MKTDKPHFPAKGNKIACVGVQMNGKRFKSPAGMQKHVA